jgi:hypothetical protein
MFPCSLTSNFTLDCSNLQLTAIPKNIPKTIHHLNLSYNSLGLIEEDAFDECCENLKVLYLSHNGISSLSRRHFEKLKKLEEVFLDSNEIANLPADIFQSHFFLKRLDLSHNPIELKRSPLLTQERIEELNLDFCNIEEIPDATFENVSQITTLTLVGNPLDENIDVDGFYPLKKLLHLNMPDLSQEKTFQICAKLVSIDIIFFETVNISCTILADDSPYHIGIITNDKIEEPIVQPLEPPTTRTPSTTTTEPPTTVSTSTASSSTSLPAMNKEASTSAAAIIETSESTNKTKLDTEKAAIEIDNDTIKFILVGESSVDEL